MSLIDKKQQQSDSSLLIKRQSNQVVENTSFEVRFFFPKFIRKYGPFDTEEQAKQEARKIARRVTTSKAFEIVRITTSNISSRYTFENSKQRKKAVKLTQKMEQVKDLLPLGTLIEIAIPKSKYSKKIVQVEAEIVEYRNGKAIVKVMEGVRKGSRFRLDPDKHHFTFAQKFERW